jgi:hypothetical protein
MLVIEVDEYVAVRSVPGKENQNDKVRHQQRHIKGIGMVEAPKRGIEKVLANVRTNSLRRSKRQEVRSQNEISHQAGIPVRNKYFTGLNTATGQWRAT